VNNNPQDHRKPSLEFNAGAMGCGELVLELRFKMNTLNAGDLIKVIAEDPGAPEDLPAWCNLTGHKMVFQNHPEYWIAKREG
jgi:tRNA 2-thiouridine synthesizing protein A